MTSPTVVRPQVVPVTDLRRYLVGTWWLVRTVVHRDGRHFDLLGDAVISESADGEFIYRERATLRDDPNAFSFTRTYRYAATTAGSAAVMFEDGVPFYALDLSRGRCRVRHDCDDDVYVGVILATETAWFTRWRCQGPAKDYVATTRLCRDHVTSPWPDRSRLAGAR